MELSLSVPKYYRVKRGQSLKDVARAFSLPPRLLCAVNRVTEAEEGLVLLIPPAGNLYVVRGGESKTLLCGSPARFAEKNGTSALYPGQTVLL